MPSAQLPRRYGVSHQLNVLAMIMDHYRSGKMTPILEDAVIHMARQFATTEGIPKPVDIKGAIRMIELADRRLRDRIEAQFRADRGNVNVFGTSDGRFVR